jgi:hypothetical protein
VKAICLDPLCILNPIDKQTISKPVFDTIYETPSESMSIENSINNIQDRLHSKTKHIRNQNFKSKD